MPRRKVRKKRKVKDLNGDQWLELAIGIAGRCAFESEEQRRAAWEYHRAYLMEHGAREGKRPWAWWKYDSGDGKSPGTGMDYSRKPWPWNEEAMRLEELGELRDDERAHLNKMADKYGEAAMRNSHTGGRRHE